MKPEKSGNDFIEHFPHKISLIIFLSFIIFLMAGCGNNNSASSTKSNTHKTETQQTQSIKTNSESYKNGQKVQKQYSNTNQNALNANNNIPQHYEDYYTSDEGTYDEGYEKGLEDAHYDWGYNPEYENDDYMAGYEDGFSEGKSAQEEENEDEFDDFE